MLKLKVGMNGLSKLTETNMTSVVEVEVTEDTLNFMLGKVLYSVEQQGFNFVTSEIYDDVITAIDNAPKLKNTYQKIYNESDLEISLKTL